MSSSLASQLANIGSLDASRLSAASAKSRPSFLFSPRQAASLSNADIHGLGYNGFLALLAEDARLERYETPLFGEKAKSTDRALLTKDENAKLDRVIASLLRAVAGRFLVKNTGKVLEWLIRRFRINELNVDDVMALILPYHETPQFAQMLQILELDSSSDKFAAFGAVKKSLQPLPRHHLLTAMAKSHPLFLWVANLLKPYVQERTLHPALASFWTASLVGYIDRASKIAENQMLVLLPVLVDGLKTSTSQDVRMGSCLILSRLAPKVELNDEAMEVIIDALLSRRAATADVAEMDGSEATVTTLVILCESQRSAMPTFPKKALSNILKSSEIMDAVVALSASHAADKLLRPLFAAIIEASPENDRAASVLIATLSPTTCPAQITTIALPLLIAAAARKSQPSVAVQALNVVSQRDAEAYYLACEAAQKARNAEEKAAIKKVMAAVSGYGLFGTASAAGSTANADADVTLSLGSSEPQTRAKALSEVLSAAASSLSVEDAALPAPLLPILLDRLADPALAVANVLFAEANSAILALAASQAPKKALEACTGLVKDAETPRATAFLHLRFLCTGLQSHKEHVLRQAVWPKLLATKANSKLWKGLWALLKEQTEAFELLAGCESLVNTEADKDDLPLMNDKLAAQIAKNVQTDNDKAFLLASLVDSSAQPTSKLLSSLVLAKLVTMPQQADAQLVRRVMSSTSASASMAADAAEAPLAAIYSKPTSAKTQAMAVAHLRLSAILSISSPTSGEGNWCWLAPQAPLSADVQAFSALCLEAYTWAHKAGTTPATATSILSALFSRAIGEDALAFFAFIFTASQRTEKLRLIALADAQAFLQANEEAVKERKGSNDLQLLLPSLLVALAAPSKDIRKAAFGLLEYVSRLAKKLSATDSPPQRIYGFDAFYGSRSSTGLQYLQPAQVHALCRVLLDGRTDLLLDGTGALRVLLSSQLDEAGISRKKSLSHAVLCFLASHALVWQDVQARTSLLGMLRNISDSSKIDLYTPLLTAQGLTTLDQAMSDEYAVLLLEAFAALPKPGLTDENLAKLLECLQNRQTDKLSVALRAQLRERIRLSLFAAVSPTQRLLMLERLISLALKPILSEALAVKQLLHSLDIDAQALVAFLANVGQSLSGLSSEARPTSAKKSRSVSSSQPLLESDSTRLLELGTFLENADSEKVEASTVALGAMLETLGALVELNVSKQIDVAYIAQLLMATASSVASRLAETTPPPTFEGIRISPVMETIRISTNPTTSNSALTLIAELVKLVPEQVVQNIMPIFTFMGTSILQRDDAYSCRIVDRTIDSTIPALVKDRSKRALTREHLVIEMNDFMRTFADAANHVPRHRRNRLFIRFAEVLGPQTFLAPLCSLLVDKVALRYSKTGDATLLNLPQAVASHFPAFLQLTAAHQLVSDLFTKVQQLNTEASEGSLASRQSTPTTPAESPALPVNTSRRTVLASLVFLNNLINAKALASQIDKSRAKDSEDLDVTLQDLMKTATSFYTIAPQKLSAADIGHLLEHVQAFVLSAGKLLTVPAFSDVVEWAIKDEDTRVVQVALDLLVIRLKSIKAAGRPALSPSMLAAMERLRGFLQSPSGKFDRTRALHALRLLSVLAADDEISSISQSLSAVLGLAEKESSKTLLNQAMGYISENIGRLEARVIPLVTRIVALSNRLVKASASGPLEKTSVAIAISSLAALSALFQTVPTFAAAHQQAVLQLCVDTSVRKLAASDASDKLQYALGNVLAAATRKTPSKSTFANISTLWEKTIDKSNSVQINAFLDAFFRSLRATTAANFTEVYKQAFAIMLAVFDTRRSDNLSEEETLQVENTAISAYMNMVLKLNEGTFRPLFLRLFDWAVMDVQSEPEAAERRTTTLFRIVDRMLSQLKTIALPYYAFVLEQALQILDANAEKEPILLEAVMSTLRRAFEHDTIGFWTPNRLSKLVQPIARRGTAADTPEDSYTSLLVSYAQAIETQESTLHDLIKACLEQTRSDKPAEQLAALRSLQTLWDAGIDAAMAAHSAESMPYLVETLEAGGEVARATKALLARMNEDAGQESDESEEGSGDSDGDDGEDDDEEMD